MPTVVMLRHGRSTANTAGVLAGWSEGIGLDDVGLAQAERAGQRLSKLPLVAVVSSPLQRCQETAAAVIAASRQRRPALVVQTDPRVGEVHYGDWTGRPLRELAKLPLWKVVQNHPSAAVFPGPQGEGLAAMQARAVQAVREHDAAVAAAFGPQAVWLLVSHGDVIKAILADALGSHLDSFQRIVIDTASISVIKYAPLRPFVLRMNEVDADLSTLAAPPRRRRSATVSSDAVVGGETGTPSTA